MIMDLLDKIRERNFGFQLDVKPYAGDDPATLLLLEAGIGCYSLFSNGKDIRVPLYDFNDNRSEEGTNELIYHITNLIRAHG